MFRKTQIPRTLFSLGQEAITIYLALANQILELHKPKAQKQVFSSRLVKSHLLHPRPLQPIKVLLEIRSKEILSVFQDNEVWMRHLNIYLRLDLPKSKFVCLRNYLLLKLRLQKIKPLYHTDLLLYLNGNLMCNSETCLLSHPRLYLKKPC